MRKLLANPLVQCTVVLNLFFGCLVLSLLAKDERHTLAVMAACYAPVAVAILLLGFRAIRAALHWWKPPLLAVFCTALVPFAGSCLLGFVLAWPDNGLIDVLGKGLMTGIFGLMFGSIFAVPFAVGNALAFCLFWKRLRRDNTLLKVFF